METNPQPSGTPGSKQVLVVDHDDDARRMLAAVAGRQGFRVETAGAGYEAIRKIRQSGPDLVVLDMMLPDAGSYEVLRNLQEAGKAGAPIVILTDANLDAGVSDILRHEPNVVDCLRKPIQDNVLAETLRWILDTRTPS